MDPTIRGITANPGMGSVTRLNGVRELGQALEEGRPNRTLPTTPAAEPGTKADTSIRSAAQAAQGDTILPLERTLPLAILSNPRYIQAEWGWRRLLTELWQWQKDGMSERPAEPASAAASARTVPAPVPSPLSETSPVQGPSPAAGTSSRDAGFSSTTATPKAVEATRSVPESSPLPGTVAMPAGASAMGGAQFQGTPTARAVSRIGPAAAGQPAATASEVASDPSGTAPYAAAPEVSTAAEQSLQSKAVEALWAAMTSLVERSSAGASAGRATLVHPTFLRDAPGIEASDGGRLIPFHAVRAEHLAGARGDALEAWVTADRMSAAVQDPDGTVTGAGIWVPGPARDDERRLVVRWQGERQSRTGPNGQTVHRLRLTVPYEGRTVAIHFICSYPSLYIHFGTDHRALRQRLERSQAQAAAALSRVGWRMDGWSVGDLEEADA